MKIVIDMMGGDNGTSTTIEATKLFIKDHKDATMYLVGDETLLRNEFAGVDNVIICPSKTIVAMDADPMSALKDLDSSLMVSVKTYLENNCDVFVSAGSTGALLTAAVFKIKRIPGIKRPCLTTTFPTLDADHKFIVCDLGANNSNTAEELVQFAIMGSVYYKILFNKERPEVFLLSNGTEDEKGSPLNKEAFPMLKANENINFKGNIEAREPLKGGVDVLITDGYTGNIFLKTIEGTAKMMGELIKGAFKKNLSTKIGYLFSKKGVAEMKDKMDYKKIGGALLLGVNGIVLKAHGNSSVISFEKTIETGYDLASKDMLSKIKEALQ